MHLIALVERAEHVCCRYRLAAFRPFLASAGHALHFVTLPRRWLARLHTIHAIQDTDAVIVQRKMLSQEPRCGNYVIVQEQQEISGRSGQSRASPRTP